MQIDITCPNCNEPLIIEVAPTEREYELDNYEDMIDLICAVAWESVNVL